MRLRTISPPLTDELLEALEACNIKTDVELLFTMTPMEIYRKISPTSVPLADLIAEVDRVAAIAAAPAICAEDVLERETTRHDAPSTEYSSGIPELDGLIAGFAGPKLIEVSGDKGSCKTLLALQVAVRHLSSCLDHNALWVDTTGDFSIDRVIPILQDCRDSPGVNTAAARLRLGLAFDLDTLYEVLRPLESSHQPEPTCLLIIDNLTPLFRPTLSAVSAQGHASMAIFMRHLRSLANTHSLSILLINNTSAVTPGGLPSFAPTQARKPALGPSFTYMTDVTLWLSKQTISDTDMDDNSPKTPVFEAEILRSRVSAPNTRCTFKMKDEVLCSITQGPEPETVGT